MSEDVFSSCNRVTDQQNKPVLQVISIIIIIYFFFFRNGFPFWVLSIVYCSEEKPEVDFTELTWLGEPVYVSHYLAV